VTYDCVDVNENKSPGGAIREANTTFYNIMYIVFLSNYAIPIITMLLVSNASHPH